MCHTGRYCAGSLPSSVELVRSLLQRPLTPLREDVLAGLELDDALGMARVGDRTETEADDRELRREAERLEQPLRDDEAERRVHRAVDGARPERHDEHHPEHAEDRRVARDRVDRAVVHREQTAAEAGDAGGEREQHDAQQRAR